MRFEYWQEGIILISIFFIIMAVPCIGVAWIGYRMLNQLGQHPSKTPAIQMSIFLKLIVIELVSFGMIIGFYRIGLFLTESLNKF